MRTKEPILFPLIFASVFFAVGLIAYQTMSKALVEDTEAPIEWPSVQGIVTFSELEELNNQFSPNIKYEYSIGGEQYSAESIRIKVSKISMKRGVEKTIKKYAVGTAVTVYYNPESPNIAVLEPKASSLFKILSMLPLLFCVGGVGMVLKLFKRIFFRWVKLGVMMFHQK